MSLHIVVCRISQNVSGKIGGLFGGEVKQFREALIVEGVEGPAKRYADRFPER